MLRIRDLIKIHQTNQISLHGSQSSAEAETKPVSFFKKRAFHAKPFASLPSDCLPENFSVLYLISFRFGEEKKLDCPPAGTFSCTVQHAKRTSFIPKMSKMKPKCLERQSGRFFLLRSEKNRHFRKIIQSNFFRNPGNLRRFGFEVKIFALKIQSQLRKKQRKIEQK